MTSAEMNTGTLYVVATPIGNLADLTRRAENILASVEIVAAEDTRRTAVLLDHIGHRAPQLLSYHEHNKKRMTLDLLERLERGHDVALVSDAGTPLVNDPGAELVAAATSSGIKVVPVPGASAITAALSVCPFSCYPFTYVGFLPSKQSQRKKLLQESLEQKEALVFFEAPHRVEDTLSDLVDLTERRLLVGRELTKQYETIQVGTASEIVEQGVEARGEFVLIVELGEPVDLDVAEYRRVLKILLEDLSPSQAARTAASILKVKKSALYDLAQEMAQEK